MAAGSGERFPARCGRDDPEPPTPPSMLYCHIIMETTLTTNLRKVGGSIMLAVPPALLNVLHWQPGARLGVSTQDGRLVIEPQRHRYTLDELLAQCDPTAPFSEEDREWVNSPPVGRELI